MDESQLELTNKLIKNKNFSQGGLLTFQPGQPGFSFLFSQKIHERKAPAESKKSVNASVKDIERTRQEQRINKE